MVGESPYLAGAVPCSWCPDDKPFCQNNLCGEPALESASYTLSCLIKAILAKLYIYYISSCTSFLTCSCHNIWRYKTIMIDILNHSTIFSHLTLRVIGGVARRKACAHAQINTPRYRSLLSLGTLHASVTRIYNSCKCVCRIIIPSIRHTLQTQENCRMRVPRRKLITRSSV